MTESRRPDWQTVRELFESCVDLELAARTDRLAAADPMVRAEVETLLLDHARSGDRLQPDLLHRAVLDAFGMPVAVGDSIAGYRLVGVLGRGGMGTVFRAEQERPRREVAIKLLDTVFAGGDAERRFQLEAEVLGRLQHEGIARIHSAGVHEERTAAGVVRLPYFVMEYVPDALTIDVWRGAADRSEAEVLGLFAQLCTAVQHAHERGVVHRDLKPHNVLVDGSGRVRVIDFGIARGPGNEERGLTRTGDLIGTLRYMSPEQVRGEPLVDTRTDVHALGVILFELLAQRSPFDVQGRSLPEAGRILAETSPQPLRACLPAADADLELILATAMAKDPGRRYGTAGALGEDLARYRARQPISARPPSATYQLAMFARRRKALVFGGLAFLAVAIGGGVTSAVYALRAHRSEVRAVAEAAQKAAAVRRVFDGAIATVLDVPKKLVGVPGATALRRDVIAAAFEQLEFVAHEAPLDDDMRVSLARAYLDLAGVQGASAVGNVGDKAAAQASLDLALEHARHVAAARPDDRSAFGLLFEVEMSVAEFDWRYDRAGRFEDSWDAVRATLERLRVLSEAEDPRLLNATATVLVQEGHLGLARREPAVAVEHFRAAIERYRRAGQQTEVGRRERLRMALARRFEAIACELSGDAAAARAALEAAIESMAFAADHPEDVLARQLVATLQMEYGVALVDAGELAAGEAQMRAACAEHERLFAADPQNAAAASTLAASVHRLADHLATAAAATADAAERRREFTAARALAVRGLELALPLRERSRDMVNVLVVAECERIRDLCDEALR
ncbi:MAG: serine/threonine protein kinase [Planctomycetes bacterium]|nr:serine/threonine protein kinase [Planctomycetota bacterium]